MAAWTAGSGRLAGRNAARKLPWNQEPKPAPRMLRVGIVAGGRIVEERLIRAGKPVSVGEHPRATVVVPKAGLPDRRFVLFGVSDGGWELRFVPGMRGKLTVDGQVVSLGGLLESGLARRKRSVWAVPLAEGTRGKVHVGEFTFLFQTVVAPPRPARPPVVRFRRPPDLLFRSALLTSAMVHVAALFWVQAQPTPRPVTIEDLPTSVVQYALPLPAPLPEPEVEVPDPTPTAAEEPTPSAGDRGAPGPGGGPAGQTAPGAASDQGEKTLAVIKTLLEGTDELLSDASDFDSEVREAFEASGPIPIVRRDDAGPRTAEFDEVVRTDGIEGAGGGGGGTVERVATAPKPRMEQGPIDVDPEAADGVAAVLKPYRPAMKACYERQIKNNPDLAGKMVLSWVIAADGTVEDLAIDEDGLGSDALARCIRRTVGRITFPVRSEETYVDGYPLIFGT